MITPETSLRPGGPTPAGGDTRTWRIEFPPQQQLLNANRDLNRYARARLVRQLRGDACKLARFHKVPHLQRARIDCIYEPPDNRTRDAANWAPTAKALVDGLIDAGMCDDDDHTRVAGPFMHIGDKHPGGRIVLIITELTTPAVQGDQQP